MTYYRHPLVHPGLPDQQAYFPFAEEQVDALIATHLLSPYRNDPAYAFIHMLALQRWQHESWKMPDHQLQELLDTMKPWNPKPMAFLSMQTDGWIWRERLPLFRSLASCAPAEAKDTLDELLVYLEKRLKDILSYQVDDTLLFLPFFENVERSLLAQTYIRDIPGKTEIADLRAFCERSGEGERGIGFSTSATTMERLIEWSHTRLLTVQSNVAFQPSSALDAQRREEAISTFHVFASLLGKLLYTWQTYQNFKSYG